MPGTAIDRTFVLDIRESVLTTSFATLGTREGGESPPQSSLL